MRLTQKIKINPTPEQIEVFWHLSERCRLLYNFALAERKREWEVNKVSVKYLKQQNDLPELKKKYPEYKWVYSKVLQMTLKTLDADFKSFYSLWKNADESARPPKFKGKNHFCTLKYNQSGYKINGNTVILSHSYNDNLLEFTIPDKFRFEKVYQIDVYLRDGDFYLSVIYDVPAKEYVDNELYQAWDLGIIKQTGVNTQGKFIEITNIRPDKYWKKPIAELQSGRDHCKRISRKWNKLNDLKKKCERKRSNQMRDFQHKCSRKIIDNTKANTIIIGDLDVKKMAQSKNAHNSLNASTQGTGYLGRFAGFLTYKAELSGKKVIEISEYRTSKACCVCGKLHDMPLWKRNMECDCGNNIDRDRNSAVNIMVRFLSQNAMWTGYQQFADNLRKTGVDIPLHSQEAPCESVA